MDVEDYGTFWTIQLRRLPPNCKSVKMKVNYKCKDNDVKLQFHCEDGVIDEVWVKIDGEKSWTVVGYSDLLSGVEKVKRKSNLSQQDVVKSDWDIRRCFESLRATKEYHLGNGDIRLPIEMQEVICIMVEHFYRCRT